MSTTAFSTYYPNSFDITMPRHNAYLRQQALADAPLNLVSPKQVVSYFRDQFAERIDLTDRAWKSLKGCKTGLGLLWNAMRDLCTILYDLLRSKGGVDVRGEFDRQSTLSYSSSAGMMTRKDSKLIRGYRDEYHGRKINCEAHIRKGGKASDPNSVRIYFCFDRETGKIIISSIGRHLGNYSTRKLH